MPRYSVESLNDWYVIKDSKYPHVDIWNDRAIITRSAISAVHMCTALNEHAERQPRNKQHLKLIFGGLKR